MSNGRVTLDSRPVSVVHGGSSLCPLCCGSLRTLLYNAPNRVVNLWPRGARNTMQLTSPLPTAGKKPRKELGKANHFPEFTYIHNLSTRYVHFRWVPWAHQHGSIPFCQLCCDSPSALLRRPSGAGTEEALLWR